MQWAGTGSLGTQALLYDQVGLCALWNRDAGYGDLEKGMWSTGTGSEAIQAIALWCLLRAWGYKGRGGPSGERYKEIKCISQACLMTRNRNRFCLTAAKVNLWKGA